MSLGSLHVAGNGSTPSHPILSLTQLIDERASSLPHAPAIHTILPSSWAVHTLSYTQLRQAIYRLAWHYDGLGLRLKDGGEGEVGERVVGIFAQSSLTLTFTEFALHRLGCTALLISPNNSASAVAALLKATGAHTLIVGGQPSADVGGQPSADVGGQPSADMGDAGKGRMWDAGEEGLAEVPPYPSLLTPEEEHERPAIILHSSGSTGHPKPLVGTHRTVVANGAWNFGLRGATVLPLYHGFGHHSTLRCLSAAQPLSVFPPHLPLTAANILRFFSAEPLQQLFAVAYVLKLLAEDAQAAGRLARFGVVSYAGSALPDEIGDALTARGVSLLSQYGTTETGSILTSARVFSEDKAWNWLRPSESAKRFLRMERVGDDPESTYEAVVLPGYPSLAIASRPDGSFATKDLFVRHPDHDDWWKYVGRLDDTLTQTLGEKTNPVPIELTLRGASAYIDQAIVFGAGRPQIGALVLLSEQAVADGLTPRAALLSAIWPAVALANRDAPSHSQLVPELIAFLPPGTDVPLATKGSILRPACYARFGREIEAVYERYESADATKPKLALTIPELQSFLSDAIARTLGAARAAGLKEDTDLFNFGIDSLQATRVRMLVVREVDVGEGVVSQNVVYEHPSIEQLAAHLYALRTGTGAVDKAAEAARVHDTMRQLLDKYASRLDTHSPSPSASSAMDEEGHVVVLTGTTGSLGAHIIHRLLSRSDVRRVIALARASSDAQALERVKASLEQRKLPPFDVGRVRAYAADLDKDGLGLSEAAYGEIRDEATAVVHNGWSVNFNLGVESFEADNIRGAFNLLNLCLRSPRAAPASFYFSSSVSARQGIWSETAPEAITDDPAYAAPTGYARSKWITENLCRRAAEERGIHAGVLRIGQMVGDTEFGVWNTTEAIPLLFRSAQVVHALPLLDDHPSFLPVDVAASAIAEIVGRGSLGAASARLYHIVNPQMTTSWAEILDFLKQAGLAFEAVDRHEWIRRLEGGPSDPAVNPTFKLLDFFRNRYGRAGTLPPSIRFETVETGKVAPSISATRPVDAALVAKWVAYWREIGFLN
ncbi:hypothetical protein PLICRDRAFT_117812 [Plicaturopsis crispa FD-325 SS-3]|uniref:Unplaced genomic scaffold PLICRscaffold_17, whole genome shotgun sequence n=1 Tax=Plicaturopsis crispa FD-325 SS-3 TaxID=944288 RepID=A0A0C9T5A9_PLICR|nr:hypothetical protein PLICRDRAFT_117812 [Plicaturopsis crispa FD-325 SS-3]